MMMNKTKLNQDYKTEFSIADVPRKKYCTPATFDLHSDLHFARKNKVYCCIHCAKKNLHFDSRISEAIYNISGSQRLSVYSKRLRPIKYSFIIG